jgi:hypothetical protein
LSSKEKVKKNLKSIPIEVSLWDATNKLRGSVELAEYKQVVLRLIFLKFPSDKLLKGKLPDNYFSRLGLDTTKLSSLLDIINEIETTSEPSIKFIEAHNGNKKEVSIYGQDYKNTSYKLANRFISFSKKIFYDREIQREFVRIQRYIQNNPENWYRDSLVA